MTDENKIKTNKMPKPKVQHVSKKPLFGEEFRLQIEKELQGFKDNYELEGILKLKITHS